MNEIGPLQQTLQEHAAVMNDDTDRVQLAERVRAALLECALAAHEDARLRGLCMEGAWEAAISAMCALDVAAVVRRETPPSSEP